MRSPEQLSFLDRDSFNDSITHDILLEDILLALPNLPPEEQAIVRFRFGLNDGNIKSPPDAIATFKISEDRLTEIEKKLFSLLGKQSKPSETSTRTFPDTFILDLIALLHPLEEKEREILRRKWGLFDGRPWTTAELATEYETSPELIEALHEEVAASIKGKEPVPPFAAND